MKKEILNKKIKTAIENAEILNSESQEVKNFIFDVIYLTFKGLESDGETYENGKRYTPDENLRLALEINLRNNSIALVKKAIRAKK